MNSALEHRDSPESGRSRTDQVVDHTTTDVLGAVEEQVDVLVMGPSAGALHQVTLVADDLGPRSLWFPGRRAGGWVWST